MSVDNVTVSLSRLALAKAIKTPDTDDAEPWSNSVIFHQPHIPTRMRERVQNPYSVPQAQAPHRPIAHIQHHRPQQQQQPMRRSMVMERASHDSRHSKKPDRNLKLSADRASKSRIQHPVPSDDEEEEGESDEDSQDDDEQVDEIEKRTDARRMSTLRQLERGPATNHSLHQRSRSAGDMDMLHQQHPQQKRPTMPVTARSSSSSSSSAASSGTRTPPLASSMIPSRAMTPNSKPQYSHLHPQPRANAAAANTHHRRSTGNMDGIMSSARPVATTVQPRTKPVSRPASTVYGYHPQQQQQQQQEVYRRSMDIDLLYQQQQQMQQQMQTYPHSMYAHGTNAMLRPGKQHGRPSSDLLMPPQRQPTPQPALSYYSPQPSRRSLAAMVDGVQQQDHRHKKPQKSRHQRNGSHTHVSGGSGYVYDQTSTNARRRAEMRRMDPMPTQTRSTPQPSYNMNNMNNMNNMMPMTQQAYLPGTYAYPNYY